MLQKTTIISLISLLSSCAQITYIPEKKEEAIVEKKSPSNEIVMFQETVEKDQITQIINEQYEEPNEFLKNVKNKNVNFWINYFGKREKDRFERFLANGERFKKVIEDIFEDHGLPKELYYVGLIESGYYLGARSHANAVGPWQFIKSTAKRYGLKVNSQVDERRSIHKSTKAAALFFQDLYNIFGSWELALSAYNAGEYGIIRRIRNANTRDYYQLSLDKKLPKETIHYVPKVLAAIELATNPQKYNIKISKNSNNFYNNTKPITLNKSYHLKEIAKVTNTSFKTLTKLNPDLRSSYTPNSTFDLIVPKNINNFLTKVTPYKKSNNVVINNEIHKVKKGENLYIIAKRYKTSITELLKSNKLKNKTIFVGQKLKVNSSFEIYKVMPGDYLGKIARTNHTSVSTIMKLNNLRSKTIYKGQTLKIPTIDKTIYTVRRGDYLGKIADRFGISISKIKKLNSMRRSKIYPGQRLIVSIN